jgi:hypothetical protein
MIPEPPFQRGDLQRDVIQSGPAAILVVGVGY